MADVAQTHRLLHGRERDAYLDAGYTGVEKRPEIRGRFPGVRWWVAAKRGGVKKMAEGPRKELVKALEKCKAQLRAYVEHPFHVLKNLFGHRKARYRGLAKNRAHLHTLFALVNLVIAAPLLRRANAAARA